MTVQFHPGGVPVFDILRPEEVPFSDFMPGLLDAAVDLSDDAHREAVHVLLRAFTGLERHKDDPVAAWREWFEKQRDGVWRAR